MINDLPNFLHWLRAHEDLTFLSLDSDSRPHFNTTKFSTLVESVVREKLIGRCQHSLAIAAEDFFELLLKGLEDMSLWNGNDQLMLERLLQAEHAQATPVARCNNHFVFATKNDAMQFKLVSNIALTYCDLDNQIQTSYNRFLREAYGNN